MEENRNQEEEYTLSGNPETADDEVFDAELTKLMQEDNSGKKKTNGNRRKWSGKRKFLTALLVIVGLFVVIGGFNLLFGGKGKPHAVVMTVPIVRQDIQESLSLSGPISGTDSVDVVSNLHAEVLDIRVKEGDKVEKDQLLATLDQTDAKKEVDIAQNAYDLAVSTQKEQQILAENGYAKAQQEYQDAKANLDRTTALFQGGGVSQLDLEDAKKRLNEASRQLKTFTLQNGKPVANESYSLQVKNAEFELEKKKTLLDNTQIKSPIAGTVTRVNAKIGRFADKVEDEKPMFIIENLDVLEMQIPVSEYSIGKIKVGQTATISADILNGEEVSGKVTAISPTGEEKGGGSSERVIPTTIRIDGNSSKLIAGITATARLILNESKNALAVPFTSIISKDDGSYIATVQDKTLHLIKVDVGVESDTMVEVKPTDDSVKLENAQVVTNPNPAMTDGMQVMVMPGA